MQCNWYFSKHIKVIQNSGDIYSEKAKFSKNDHSEQFLKFNYIKNSSFLHSNFRELHGLFVIILT